MRIVVPEQFYHAGYLSQQYASRDPRRDVPEDRQVDIDMRRCEFVRPAAVLWSAAYLTLAVSRGAACRLLVPEDMWVCAYLKSVGLFSLLQGAGVEVDDRGVGERLDPKVVLPVTRFQSEYIDTSTAHQRVITAATNQQIITSATLQGVVTLIADQYIVAGVTDQGIVPITSDQDFIIRTTGQNISNYG